MFWRLCTCHFSVPEREVVMLHPQIHSSHQIGNRYEPGLLLVIPLQEEVWLRDLKSLPLQSMLQSMLLLTEYFLRQQQMPPHVEYLLMILLLSSLIATTARKILAPIMANAIKVILKGLWDNPHLKNLIAWNTGEMKTVLVF